MGILAISLLANIYLRIVILATKTEIIKVWSFSCPACLNQSESNVLPEFLHKHKTSSKTHCKKINTTTLNKMKPKQWKNKLWLHRRQRRQKCNWKQPNEETTMQTVNSTVGRFNPSVKSPKSTIVSNSILLSEKDSSNFISASVATKTTVIIPTAGYALYMYKFVSTKKSVNKFSSSQYRVASVCSISDNIIVFGKTQVDHDWTLDQTLQQLDDRSFTFNQDKCLFSVPELVTLVLRSLQSVCPQMKRTWKQSKVLEHQSTLGRCQAS